jgi:UDP-N-acetylmuramyl pentapeptide synthase
LQPSFLITVGKDAYQIAAGAREKGQKAADILSFETVDQLISHWQSNPNLSSKGDVIYIKASNGIKLCKLVDHIMAVEKKCVG